MIKKNPSINRTHFNQFQPDDFAFSHFFLSSTGNIRACGEEKSRFVSFTVTFSPKIDLFFIFLYNKLHFDNKTPAALLSACSYRPPVRDPASLRSAPSYTAQTETLRLMEAMNGFMENSCVESVPALSLSLFFFYLMNEISHAALLQALAHLGGSTLSLFLSLSPSLMPSNTLLPFVNY